MFILSSFTNEVFLFFGTTSIDYLKKQYYRWLTCIFLHASIGHVIFNSIGLIAISSLIKFYLTNWKLLIIFLLGGVGTEMLLSFVLTSQTANYGGGASGGIYSLIGAFSILCLHNYKILNNKYSYLSCTSLVIYFLFSHVSKNALLTHIFGFAFGSIISLIVLWIDNSRVKIKTC